MHFIQALTILHQKKKYKNIYRKTQIKQNHVKFGQKILFTTVKKKLHFHHFFLEMSKSTKRGTVRLSSKAVNLFCCVRTRLTTLKTAPHYRV